MQRTDPIRPTDDAARVLARRLLETARHGALAVADPDTGAPYVSRVAVGLAPDGAPVTLVSALSHHTRALTVAPDCALLIGEPGPKGDPLAHPRLTLMARAAFVPRGGAAHAALRDHYLKTHGKARLYADFADFGFVRLEVVAAHLNGGFGQAYHLTASDLLTG